MNRLLAAVFVLLTAVAPVLAQPAAIPFGQGTHAFRRILHDLNFKPLRGYADITDPSHTLVIVLGDTDVLEGLPGGVKGFVEKGGAVLIATDRLIHRGILLDEFGFSVTGHSLRVADARRTQRYYQNLPECPYLVPATGKSGASLFRRPPLVNATPTLDRVATNKPSDLRIDSLAGGMQMAAYLPQDCLVAPPRFAGLGGDFQLVLQREHSPFAVTGTLGAGRLLVLADHSLFINDMMLRRDTDNIDFTYNCLDWLNDGKEVRDQALFIEEGSVRTQFDIPLKEMPPELPSLDEMAKIAEPILADFEDRNGHNEFLLSLFGNNLEKVIITLLIMGTAVMCVYGFYRISWARHRIETGVPVFATAHGRLDVATPTAVQRQRALLKADNFWETARALARAAFESAQIPAHASPGMPVVTATGGFWKRWAMRSLVARLWRLAYHSRPVRVSQRDIIKLKSDIETLKAALRSGTVRLSFPEKA